MPYALNDKIRELTPYEPISGAFQIRLDANESYLSLPEPVLAEIRARLEKLDFNRYPDPIGGELCRAFAGYYGIDPKFVTAGNGSDRADLYFGQRLFDERGCHADGGAGFLYVPILRFYL